MALRRELAQSGTLQASLDRVARTQGGTADGSAIEEALIALELRGRLDDASAEEALRSALAALAQGGDTAAALAPWAAHAWSRMSPAARVTTAARQLAYAAAGHAAHAGWLADPVAGQPALPAPADWLFAAAEQRVALSAELRRFADGTVNLVLGPEQPATQALHRLELPAGRPLWLRVRSGEAAAQTVEVDPGQLTQVDIGSYALDQPVELHTLQGEAVALTGTTLVAGLRGVILGAGFMEWVAVVLDGGVAVALPVVQPKTVPKLGDMLELREPEAGWTVPARVLGVASASNGGPLPGALALELTRREGRALALDFQVSLPQPGPAGSGAFVSLGFGKPQPEKPVSKNADGGWVANSALVPPGLLAEAGPQGSWSVVPGIDNSTSPPSLRTVPMAALRDWARHCVASQTLYLVLSAGVEGTAQALHKALARRLGDWRVADQGDIRLLTWTERDWAEAAPRTLVVVVGVSAPDASVQGLLQRAVAAGCDLLWVPLHSDAERVLALWPKALAETMATSQQVGQGYWSDPVRLAEYVASISPAGRKGDRRPAPASPATSARGAPAPQAPRGSLRARFVALVENREDQDLGLFRIAAEQGWSLVSADRLPAAQPLLLFIHGIAGDTKTNFGALLCEPNAERERLARAYPGAIFTWHYRSITQGPLANAVALLKAVPARARLHLVSYSGGGVIAELLCRGMREGTAVDERDVALMGAAAERGSAEPQHQALLGELAALLAERAAQIERFVRIAAPIEGSGTRADGGGTRLTQTLPFFGGLLSALPGVDAFLSDASLVPGSASLAPGAGVQALLTRSVRVHAPLTVIAGMSRPGGSVLARAGTWLARSLGTEGTAAATEGSGDGWVSLASAFGGMERAGGVDYLIEEGEDIAHAGYMQLPRLRRALVDALLAQALPAPGFAHASTLAELQQRFTPPAA